MVGSYQIKIYGTDDLITSDSNSEVLESLVTAASGLVSISLKTLSFNKGFQDEFEANEREGKVMIDNSVVRSNYNFKCIYSTSEFTDYDYLSTVMSKKHKYLKALTTSPYSIHTSGYCIAGVFTTKIEHGAGSKTLELEFMKRKPNA